MNRLAVVGHIEFEYVNWRGDRHIYDGAVESIEFAPQPAPPREELAHDYDNEGSPVWLMHVNVTQRDSEIKPGRRTFVMKRMHHVKMEFISA